MKMIVVTTITSTVDVETLETSHTVHIDDSDGISEVSPDVLGAVVMGALASTKRAVVQAYPRVGKSAKRSKKREKTDKAIDIESV